MPIYIILIEITGIKLYLYVIKLNFYDYEINLFEGTWSEIKCWYLQNQTIS